MMASMVEAQPSLIGTTHGAFTIEKADMFAYNDPCATREIEPKASRCFAARRRRLRVSGARCPAACRVDRR